MSASQEITDVPQVVATPGALALIGQLRALHGPLMFYQSGGCCDGSVPMCHARGEMLTGDGDRLLGEVGGEPFWISRELYPYWMNTQLVLDAEAGRAGGFSLEGGTGLHFVARARFYEDAEWAWLLAAGKVEA
jgi:uncharacterized protein (DUF779 family)